MIVIWAKESRGLVCPPLRKASFDIGDDEISDPADRELRGLRGCTAGWGGAWSCLQQLITFFNVSIAGAWSRSEKGSERDGGLTPLLLLLLLLSTSLMQSSLYSFA